jgi:two-component system chemotaxis response regulator CheY
MKILIVDDDFSNRKVLEEMLKSYGSTDLAVDGKAAVDKVRAALTAGAPYDLICLDIMMPEMDGHEALKQIRALELAEGKDPGTGAKIIMTTSLGDSKNVFASFKRECDSYLVKPFVNATLQVELRKLGLIE